MHPSSFGWYDYTLLAVTTVSVLCQLYVIYLIIYLSPRAMRNYRFFMFNYTVRIKWELSQ